MILGMRRCLLVLWFAVVLPFGATAGTWLAGDMSDAGPHPRTCLVPGELEGVQSRLDREPYRSQVARLVTLAQVETDLDDHDTAPELSKANAARAAAWLFVMDRTVDGADDVVPFADEAARDAMGERAVTYLLAMYTESRAKGLIEYTEDIHTAQELHLWAEAVDLLLGADRDVLGDDRDPVVQNVADLAADFYADYAIENWIACRTLVNNHRTKSAAALGLAAIALNGETFEAVDGDGRYDPAAWIDYAVRAVDMTFGDILDDEDGGYQEAGSYLSYTGIDLAAFLWAWHRYTGGADYTMTFDEPVPPYYVLGAEQPYTMTDMWSGPVLADTLLWAIRIQLPDGTMPPFDDCTPGSRMFFGVFVGDGFENAGLHRWAWELNGQSAGGSTDVAPLILAAYDDSIAPQSPDDLGLDRHQVLPYAGQVIFRSGWETDATYASMMCEHGRAAAVSQTRWGQYVDGAAGHEHPDGTSVMLYAGGESLILDAGYLGWEDHDKVWEPSNHNLILVDGEGPALPVLSVPPFAEGPDGELVLTDYTVEGGWTASGDGLAYLVGSDVAAEGVALAEATTDYHHRVPDTRIWRRMALLADRFVVLHDRVEVDDVDPHTLTHTLHTHCGGTSGGSFESTEHGATCTRDGARLTLAVLSPVDETRTTREDIHDGGHWLELTHTVVETSVETDGAQPGEFLSVLLAEPSVDGEYEAVDLDVGGCGDHCTSWTWEGGACEAWIAQDREVRGPDGRPLVVATAGAYCVDEAALYGWFAGTADDPDALYTLRVELDLDGAPTHWRAALLGQDSDAHSARLSLPRIEGAEPDGACSWQDDGSASWWLDLAGPGIVETAAAARHVVANLRLAGVALDEPAVVELGGAATLDASGSCELGGDELTFAWELQQHPEMSVAELPASTLDSMTFTPDLPGLYEVAVTATAGEHADRAVVAFEVEGETVVPAGDDDDSAPADDDDAADDDAGDDDAASNPNPGDDCSCAAAGASAGPLLVAWLPLVLVLRRRPRPQEDR
jgi:hypothetical protein